MLDSEPCLFWKFWQRRYINSVSIIILHYLWVTRINILFSEKTTTIENIPGKISCF